MDVPSITEDGANGPGSCAVLQIRHTPCSLYCTNNAGAVAFYGWLSMASAHFVTQYEQDVVNNYCQLAACVVVFHEYLATFFTEVDVIWSRRLTTPTAILFILNRYNTLFQAVLFILFADVAFNTDLSCKSTWCLNAAFILISYVTWALFSALRVYSIGNRNTYLASASFCFGMVPFATNLYSNVEQIVDLSEVRGQCLTGWSTSGALNDMFVVATRLSVIFCDSIVLYATLSNARSPHASGNRLIKASLLTLLIRDGTLFFVLLLLMNCAQIVLWVANVFPHFSVFISPLSSIVISRFILTLRKIYLSSGRPSFVRTHHAMPSQLSSIRFTTIEVESFASQLHSALPTVGEAVVGELSWTLEEPTRAS